MDLVNGFAFKSSDWGTAGLPIIRIQNLNNPNAPFNYFAGNKPEKFMVNTGDLLFAWSGTPGTSFGAHIWRGGMAWLNQHIFKVKFPPHLLESRFLRFALNRNLDEYIREAHGAAGLAHITKARFEDSRVRIAPLNEQRRIVAAIEEQFSRIDAGVEALWRARRNLQRMRAAVLQAAMTGRLIPPDPEDEPSEVLLKHILDERRNRWDTERRGKVYREPPFVESDGLPRPERWAVAGLEQLTDPVRVICYGILKPRVPNGTVPYVEVRDLAKQVLRRDELNKTSEALHREFDRSTLKENDVLLAIRGSYDRASVASAETVGANISRDVARIAPLPGLDPEFLRLFLISPRTRAHLASKARGVGVKGVNIADIRRMAVPVPPRDEQARIVEQAARLLSLVDGLSQEINAAIQRAARLRRALLDRAFTGRLAPQDSSDEPAGVLLDRIKAARTTHESAAVHPRRRSRQ